jgi:FecR protein/RTX calcium-binding nonapeptide repeat (4 copies)
MTAGTFDTTVTTPVSTHPFVLVDGLSGQALSVPFDEMALRAEFVRQGPDLLIEGRGGEQVLVQDYFSTETPADLLLADGAGVLKGSLVAALAGSATPGQYAQLDDAALSSGAVGQVEALDGDAYAVHVDGTRVPLEVGSAVYMGDVLETTYDGAVAIAFIDGTRFSLAEDARMVVDELIYDPASDSNSAAFSLVQGLFVLVSGDIAKTGDMNIETPVSTVGIRGTSAAIQAATEGLENLVTLLQDPDGNVGVVEVATLVGTVILNEIGASTTVMSADQAPSPIEILQGADIEALYRAALATMQTLSDTSLGVGDTSENETTGEAAGETANAANGSGDGADGGQTGDGSGLSSPDVAIAAFAASVGDLFAALADAIEQQEGDIAESVHEPATGTAAGETGPVSSGHGLPPGSDNDGSPVPLASIVASAASGAGPGAGAGGDPDDDDGGVAAVGDNSDVFLQGSFIELGIAANGALGTAGAPPAEFEAAGQLGLGSLSFFADNEPLGEGNATTGDAFNPGVPVENFTIAFTDGAGSFVGSNENGGGGTDIPMGLDSTSSGGGVASVTSAGGIDERIGVEQTISLGHNDTFFTTTVVITNLGDDPMTGLRYMRNADPDQDVGGGGGFLTGNDVLLNPGDGSGIAAVDAQGQSSGQSILLLADQTALNISNGLEDGSIQVRASAFGFENHNPFAASAFDNPADPNGAIGDVSVNLVYDLPDLAPGESITISWVTSINTASDGNDYLVARIDETVVDGGDGNDVIFAARADTSETLNGGNGDDSLFAASAEGSGDVLSGGNGADFLSSGGGADIMTGGNGPDVFYYDDIGDGYQVADNTAFADVDGAETDVITDFTGPDTLKLLSSAFGGLAPGALVNGVNFSVINESYDGTNAGANANFAAGEGTFVYSTVDNVLHYDGNGADAGYTAIAQMDQPAASDIEVVAAA